MVRSKAASEIQIDNDLVRITKYTFLPGEETRMHKHLFDYIVTPITGGKLLLIDKYGNEKRSKLEATQSYFRKAGVEHNVINIGKEKLIFVETELKTQTGDI